MSIGKKFSYNRHIIKNMVCEVEHKIGNNNVKKMHNLYLHATKGWRHRKLIMSVESIDD